MARPALIVAAALAAAVAACGPAAPFPASPPPPGAMRWRTLRAEHSTLVTARRRDGQLERRRVRGLLAAARPDRLRLRALGPGDVTLFDLVSRGDRCEVVGGLRGAAVPAGSPMAAVLKSLCHDLRAAFGLGGAPAAAPRVRYGDWRAVGASREPFRIFIDDAAAGFTADITVTRATLDEELDPSLFAPP